MKAIDLNKTLVEGYLRLLANLSTDHKLDLISKLTLSVKKDIAKNNSSFFKAFGAWESDQSAEKIITEIRSSRYNNRQIEQI